MGQDSSAEANYTLKTITSVQSHSSGTVRVPFVSMPLSASPRLCVLLLRCCLLLALLPSAGRAQSLPWWDNSYEYRRQLVVSNNGPVSLPPEYSVNVVIDHTALADAGKSLGNGNDVRVVYWNGIEYVELDRVNETRWGGMGHQAAIWFRTQAEIPASVADSSYFLYYGDEVAGSPPANRLNVYLFSDDFSGQPLGLLNSPAWTVQSGTWNVESDTQWDGTTGNVLSHDSGPGGTYKYAYVNGADYGDVVVEVKMRVKQGETSNYFPFGARLDESTGASYCAFGYASTTKAIEFPGWALQPAQLGSTGAHATMGNAWHTVQLKLEGCANMKVSFDGKDIISDATDATPPTLTQGKVYLMGYVNQKIHFDDLRVRKYTPVEPAVASLSEEKLGSRPVITLNRKWLLKADGYSAADTFLTVNACLPDSEAFTEATVVYQIPGTGMSGPMDRISRGNWQAVVDVTGLLPGTYHVGAIASESGEDHNSDLATFHVSYAFYHAWTIDWEGSYVAKSPYLDSLGALADRHGVRMTQLFNPRIYTLPGMPEWQRSAMTQWVKNRAACHGDEIGLHLHMYYDFVVSAGLSPLTSPTWAGRSDGYDVPFTAYGYEQSLALVDFAKWLFQLRELGAPASFRGGGGFADEENLMALSDRGFLDTSGSAMTHFGTLALPWALSVTSQPYYPCSTDQNESDCPDEGYNLALMEIPLNLGLSDGVTDMRPNFGLNYSGEPLDGVRVGVLTSHDRSGIGDEAGLLEQYFSYVDGFTHSADLGAVVYVTLNDIRDALSSDLPPAPDSLGPEDVVHGSTIPEGSPTFSFRVHDRDSVAVLKYRIVISKSPDYNRDTGIVVDYVSSLGPSGVVSFVVGQAASGGSYISGQLGQSLGLGVYYWKVMAIRSDGACSNWQLADGGGTAFRVADDVGVSETGNGVLSAPAISFSNPCAPNVVMRVQLPPEAAGGAPFRPTILIFDCSGRVVRSFTCDQPGAGVQGGSGQGAGASNGRVETSVSWDGRDVSGRRVSSGVYFVQLKQGDKATVKKLVLMQ